MTFYVTDVLIKSSYIYIQEQLLNAAWNCDIALYLLKEGLQVANAGAFFVSPCC